jgi:hypothetical protein
MTQYLLPTDGEFVEAIAKAIGKSRMYASAISEVEGTFGTFVPTETFDNTFDCVFDMLWEGDSEVDQRQKNGFRDDARAAISAINLKLLISS